MNANKICMIGLGYIGLPTAAVMASKGLNVLGIDINDHVISTINDGKIHIVEPGLEALVQSVVKSGHLKASKTVESSDVYVIAVPTPFKGDKVPDISFVQSAVESVIPHLTEGALVIIESTSPVGTTKTMLDVILAERPELEDKIHMAYCPERVLPGNVLYELENNDRVIGGINEQSTQAASDFYKQFVDGQLHKTNSQTAEMCKLTENAYRDVNIAFANELSMICADSDIKVSELISLANHHPRVNILQPGCGVGGHCIAVDPWFIVAQAPDTAKLIRQSREVNDYKPQWVVSQVIDAVNSFIASEKRNPTLALMGMSFKPDIDDLRESPARLIVQQLLGKGDYLRANVTVSEPNIASYGSIELSDYNEAYKAADIVVFLVAHTPFKSIKATADTIELDFCGVRT